MNRGFYFSVIVIPVLFWAGLTDNADAAFTIICLIGVFYIIYNYFFPDFPYAFKLKKHQVSAKQLAAKIHEIYQMNGERNDKYQDIEKECKAALKETFNIIWLPMKEVYNFRRSLVCELKKIQIQKRRVVSFWRV